MSVASRALHGVNVCLIPSPYNNDQPLVLRHRSLATVSAALLAIKALAILTVVLAPTPAQLSTITVNRVVQLTNTERTKAGLPALTANSALSAAAQDKGKHMLEQDYFAHISPTGVTPWFWIAKHGYDYTVAGENLAIDFTEAEDVVAAWMASPTHKANIVHSEYTETGVAVVTGEFQGGTSTIVVHMFGKPANASAAPASTPVPTPAPATAGTQQATAPTSAPTSTPTPVPTSAPTTSPTTAPLPVPRITSNGSAPAQTSVVLSVNGTPGSTIHVLANNEVAATATLSDATGSITIPIDNFPDGEIILRAYTTKNGQTSELSSSVSIIKDTTGPELASEALVFVIAPAFDTAQAVVALPQGDNERLAFFDAASPQNLEATDEFGNATIIENISLAPLFENTATSDELSAPRQIVRLSRQIAGVVLVILLMLLSLAIIIRVRIQHPALITHATLAIVLAAVLFLV